MLLERQMFQKASKDKRFRKDNFGRQFQYEIQKNSSGSAGGSYGILICGMMRKLGKYRCGSGDAG